MTTFYEAVDCNACDMMIRVHTTIIMFVSIQLKIQREDIEQSMFFVNNDNLQLVCIKR